VGSFSYSLLFWPAMTSPMYFRESEPRWKYSEWAAPSGQGPPSLPESDSNTVAPKSGLVGSAQCVRSVRPVMPSLSAVEACTFSGGKSEFGRVLGVRSGAAYQNDLVGVETGLALCGVSDDGGAVAVPDDGVVRLCGVL